MQKNGKLIWRGERSFSSQADGNPFWHTLSEECSFGATPTTAGKSRQQPLALWHIIDTWLDHKAKCIDIYLDRHGPTDLARRTQNDVVRKANKKEFLASRRFPPCSSDFPAQHLRGRCAI